MERDISTASAQKACACGAISRLGLAEVKWCIELSPTQEYQYGIGPKYREAADQSHTQ